MSGLAPEAEQVRAVRRSCAAAQERFSDLFGERAPAARVVLWAEPGYRTAVDGDAAVVFWPLAAGDKDPARLPHEIAHVLLAARYGAAGGEADGEGGYGTPLPDWLEEGVAIWAEPAVQREARVAHARRLEARFLDLGEIVTGSHPAAADPRLLRIRDGAAPPADDALWAFYPQSIAVLTFVYEHGGAAAVRAAAERFTDHGTRSRGLAGLPGLPATESGVVRAWEDWLRRGD